MIGMIAAIFCLVFGTVFGAWIVLTRFAQKAEAAKVRARLMPFGDRPAVSTSGKVALFDAETSTPGKLIPRLMERFNLRDKLRTLGEQAGIKLDPVKFVHMSMLCFLGAYAVCWVFLPPVLKSFGLLFAAGAGFTPLLILLRKRAARLRAFEEVFPDTLEFISRSMRAGHAFSVSLEMIHKEFSEPLSGEFRRTFEEHNLGLPLDVALQSLGKRIPLLDVHFFVSAVLLQKRTGGNLAEILDKLAHVIRERFKLRGRIRAVAAHGKMTGTALTCIPIGVGLLMFVVNPDYIRFFFNDETGNIMLGAAIGFQILGYVIIRKIVQIEV